MKIKNVIFDRSSFGITQQSLKMFRDAIAVRLNHRIAVVEVSMDNKCCGFLIFDLDTEDVTFSGDGFRPDKGGEGGAGYKSVEAILKLYDLRLLCIEGIADFEKLHHGTPDKIMDELLKLAQGIADDGYINHYSIPGESNPRYIREGR